MRALILAAGLATRMRPLSDLRPKPALPVRGLPVVAYLLRLLEHHGVSEVCLNLHHQPERMRRTAEAYCPAGVHLNFSHEPKLLGTGGGMRRVAEFLAKSDPCLVIAGDMLLDVDLAGLIQRHRERQDRVTLLLRRDSRNESFGTIGVDREGAVRRIGTSSDLGGETDAGVFVGVRVVAREALESLPERDIFEDLRDWLLPQLEVGEPGIRGDLLAPANCTWEPVGTLAEYLQVNFEPTPFSFMDGDALARAGGTRLGPDLIVGAGARVPEGAALERVVVWDGEQVPADTSARDGTFAGGRFVPCLTEREGEE